MAKSRAAKISLALAIVAALAALGIHFGPRILYAQFGYLALGAKTSKVPAEQIALIRKATDGLKARVAWSSSRTGNHEIYLMDLPSLEVRQLTDNGFVDFFPRFSPDGKQIVFARSQEPWVSERYYDPWDVYTMDLATGQERLAARNANFPVWAGERAIVFIRGRVVMMKNLRTGRERVLLDGSQEPVDAAISTPELSPADPNLLAFTARGRMNGVYVADLKIGRFSKIGKGCELTWFADGRRLAWIDGGGKGKTQVVASPLSPVKRSRLIDLPGEYSHEYFPRFSRDGRWLVWAASAKGHEHDIADYEIFLWQVGSPPEQALRLTFNAANDRWPDIFIDK